MKLIIELDKQDRRHLQDIADELATSGSVLQLQAIDNLMKQIS